MDKVDEQIWHCKHCQKSVTTTELSIKKCRECGRPLYEGSIIQARQAKTGKLGDLWCNNCFEWCPPDKKFWVIYDNYSEHKCKEYKASLNPLAGLNLKEFEAEQKRKEKIELKAYREIGKPEDIKKSLTEYLKTMEELRTIGTLKQIKEIVASYVNCKCSAKEDKEALEHFKAGSNPLATKQGLFADFASWNKLQEKAVDVDWKKWNKMCRSKLVYNLVGFTALFIVATLCVLAINFNIQNDIKKAQQYGINVNTCINTCTPYGFSKIEQGTCVCDKNIVRRKLWEIPEQANVKE